MVNLLKKIYSENTIIGIAIIALIVFFSQLIYPEKAKVLIEYLIPLFIIVVCLEILFMRENFKNMGNKLNVDFEYQAFNTGGEFDNYLANRFKAAKSVKVVHINSQTSNKRENRRYYEIMSDFVKAGNSFRRVFSDATNIDVYKWMKEDLLAYKNDKYFVHLLDKIKIHNIRTIGIMIIDEEEVCLGGGYVTSFQNPTISVKNKQIVKFFSDYFDYLKDNSINLKTDENLKIDILEQRIKSIESNKANSADAKSRSAD
ncbi:hypothetical protein [Desulfobacter curvatus]|uniref:hypothetical protein n=1 Tax=Desulfobacter curvatus TaxID=2290 RepID=UPI000367137C|nr:hypothetical protein [Desulfobacter curvatus]